MFKFREVIIGKEPMFTITQHSLSIKVTTKMQSAWFLFLLFLESEVTIAEGSSKLLTLDNTGKYTCLLGGIVWNCEEPIKRGVLEGKGFWRHKSDASAFQ